MAQPPGLRHFYWLLLANYLETWVFCKLEGGTESVFLSAGNRSLRKAATLTTPTRIPQAVKNSHPRSSM